MEHTNWIEKRHLDDLRSSMDPSQLVIQLGVTSYDDGTTEERLYRYVNGQWMSEPINPFDYEH